MIENKAIEIVDLPSYNMVIFIVFFVCLPEAMLGDDAWWNYMTLLTWGLMFIVANRSYVDYLHTFFHWFICVGHAIDADTVHT